MLGRVAGGLMVALTFVAASARAELSATPPLAVEPEPAFVPAYGANAELASNGDGWLLVYEDLRNSGWDAHLIVGRVDAAGRVVAPTRELVAPIRLGPAGVAFDGTTYVAAWGERSTLSDAVSIRTARLDSDGAPIGEIVTVASSSQPGLIESAVRVASAGSSTLVVWAEPTATASQARWVDVVDGVAVSDGAVEVPSTIRRLDVAFSDDAWLIAAATKDDGLRGVRVATATGASLDESSFLIDATTPYVDNPSVVAAANGWAVAWRSNTGVRIATVAHDSTPKARPDAVASVGTGFPYPKLTRAGDGFGLVAVEYIDSSQTERVALKHFAADLSTLGDPLTLVSRSKYELGATAAASDGETLLVGWEDDMAWFAKRVNSAGEAVDTEPFPLSVQASIQAEPCAAFGFGHWLVTWMDTRSGGGDIYARVLEPTGAPSAGQAFRVGGSERQELKVSVAAGADAWLVVWSDDLGSVFAARVDRSGVLLDSTPISLGAGAGGTSVTFDGSDWAVAWAKPVSVCCQGTAVVARIAPDGSVVDAAPIAVSPAGAAERYTVGITVADQNYVVSWAAVDGGYFVRQVRSDGTLADTTATTLVPSSMSVKSPTLAWAPNGGWAFWVDGNNYDLMFDALGSGPPYQRMADSSSGSGLVTFGSTVLGAWSADAAPKTLMVGVAQGGTLVPALSLTDQDELSVAALAFDGNETVLLAYERSQHLGGVLTARIETRLLTGFVDDPGMGETGGSGGAGSAGDSAGDNVGGGSGGERAEGGGSSSVGGARAAAGHSGTDRGGSAGAGGGPTDGGGHGGTALAVGGAHDELGEGGALGGDAPISSPAQSRTVRTHSGCSCHVTSREDAPAGLLMTALVGIGLTTRRRRLAS